MSRFRCTCGFAIDSADEFGDHFRSVFTREDDVGTDGQLHAELTHAGALEKMTDDGAALARILWFWLRVLAHSWTRRPGPYVCHCGYATSVTREMDDHFLLIFAPADCIGLDGNKHVPVDLSALGRWFIPRHPDAMS